MSGPGWVPEVRSVHKSVRGCRVENWSVLVLTEQQVVGGFRVL